MIIDTKIEASTLWKAKNIVLAIYVVVLIVPLVFLANNAAKLIIAFASCFLFLLFWWFQYKMNYTYLYFSDNKKNLLFRFYSMRNFSGKPRTIEISQTDFVKYDIVSGFFNRRESLILYQKTTRGIAKYPPISLTLLNQRQKTELKRTLFLMVNG